MIKSRQIKEIEANPGWNYITAITKAQINKMLRNGAFQIGLFDATLQEVIVENVRYVLRRNPLRAAELKANRQAKLRRLRQAQVERQEYLLKHPRAKTEVALRGLNQLTQKLKMESLVSFGANLRKLHLYVNQKSAAWKEAEKLDGCYVIKTNRSEERRVGKEC
jgi:hypothetical protein